MDAVSPERSPADPFGIVGSIVDGRYRIENVAGAGGFGVVYRAFHLGFDSPIAIKVLRLPDHWSIDKKRRRTHAFEREGKVLFTLSRLHSSIVRAFETGAVTLTDGALAPYLALEWLDGVSLAQELRLRRSSGAEPFQLGAMLQLLSAPAAALGRAHANGVVHRDVKPGNLFITFSDGEPLVKVLDFGIAKLVADRDGGDDTSAAADPDITAGATSSFTPMYAAPEQWSVRMGATGKWTDVHAWALVCVELITGKTPLAGQGAADFKTSCLDASTRPTPGALGVRFSQDVEAVFERALALDPRDRFPDIGTFWTSLCKAARWSPSANRLITFASAFPAAPLSVSPEPAHPSSIDLQPAIPPISDSGRSARSAPPPTTAPTTLGQVRTQRAKRGLSGFGMTAAAGGTLALGTALFIGASPAHTSSGGLATPPVESTRTASRQASVSLAAAPNLWSDLPEDTAVATQASAPEGGDGAVIGAPRRRISGRLAGAHIGSSAATASRLARGASVGQSDSTIATRVAPEMEVEMSTKITQRSMLDEMPAKVKAESSAAPGVSSRAISAPAARSLDTLIRDEELAHRR